MKRYLFECNGCACECRLLLKDAHAVARFCSANEGISNWQRSREFEQGEEAPGEIDALKSKLETEGREKERYAHACQCLMEENDHLQRRFDGLKEWISALLALGTSGLENITGRKGADNE